MAVAPGPVVERVAGGRPTVRAEPQDLARQRIPVLGQFGLLGVAGRDVEQAVAVEQQPAAVVVHAGRDAGEHRPSGLPTLPPAMLIRTTRLSEAVVR